MLEVGSVGVRLGSILDRRGFEQFEREHIKAQRAKDIQTRLGGDFDRREFAQYDKALDDVQRRVAKRDAFKATLGADYNPQAFRAYEREIKKVQKGNDDTVRSQGRLRTAFGSVWSQGGAAFAAAGGAYALVSGIKSVISASGEAELSQKKLDAQLKTIGTSYKEHATEIDRVIQATSKLAGLDDEDLQDAFTNIVRVTKDVDKGLRLVGLAADFARGKNIDVAKAGEIVAKVAGGNTGILSRYGIKIKEGADATEALGELQERFGGQAEAYGKTQAGAFDRVKVAFENLRETIGKRLGPDITRAADALARFIDQMDTGKGAGGDFVDTVKTITKVLWWLIEPLGTVPRDLRKMGIAFGGVFSGINTALGNFFSSMRDLPIVGKTFGKVGDAFKSSARNIDEWRKSLRIKNATNEAEKDIESLRKKTGSSMSEIRRSVERNTRSIKRSLGEDTKEGKDALAKNFQAAVEAIRRSMRKGKGLTEEGTNAILRLMQQELRAIGVPADKLKKPAFSQTPGDPRNKAGGGWIGNRGQVGGDTVPAMLGVGEAVLNRHQQAVVEGLLGHGFLDELFSRVQTPHYLAKGGFASGGIVPVPGFPGERAATSVIPAILNIARTFGLVLTDAFGAGHKSPGHTRYGTAADFAGPDANMDRAVRALVAQGYIVGYDGRYGSADWPGHGPAAGQGGGNAHLHVELGSGKGAGAIRGAIRKIRAPQVGGSGLVPALAQGALNRVTSGANQRLEDAAESSLAIPMPGGSGLGRGGGSSANMTLGRRMMIAAGFPANQWPALRALWQGESGWNENAINKASGAGGIPQALPASKMGAGWQGNAVQQIAWGLRYIKERYGTPSNAYAFWQRQSPHWYARGGRVRGIGEMVSNATNRQRDQARIDPKASPFRIRALERTQTNRIGSFEGMKRELENLNKTYQQADRRYGMSEEVLINEQTGEVDQAAVAKRADELQGLFAIAERIRDMTVRLKRKAEQIATAYVTIVGRLQRSLDWTKGKARTGVRTKIAEAYGAALEYNQTAEDLGFDITDRNLDLEALKNERAEVLGTQARPQDNFTGGDTGGADTGGDSSDSGPTADDQAKLAQAEAKAAELAANLAASQNALAVFRGPGDLGVGAQNAFAASWTGTGAGLGVAGSPGAIGGATGPLSTIGGGGAPIVFQSLFPPSAQQMAEGARLITSALDSQPYRVSSREVIR